MHLDQTPGLIVYSWERAQGGIGRYIRELLPALQNVVEHLHVLKAGSGDCPGKVIDLPGSGLLPALLTLGQIEIGWLSWRNHLSLIHDPTGSIPLFLSPARKVVTIHDVFPYIYPETSSTLDWLIYRCWLPVAVRRVDAIITDSCQSRNDIIQHLPVKPEKVFVIPIAANEKYRVMQANEIQPALQRHEINFPYILYVGSIEPRKNLLRLLQAFAALRKWSQYWKLVIVGARNVWKTSPVGAMVEKLGLHECVHFTGYVEEADLPALYNGADLFVFPSLYEGFGLPPLEAMACGTPVITSNVSSLPEVVGDAALLVDPYDVEAIASAMQRVLFDPDLAANMSERGLGQARQFTWERTARETLDVYRCVLESKGE